jgi:hypothetical protein
MNAFFRNASVNFEILKDQNVYLLSIPVGAPYEEVDLVIQEFKDHMLAMKLDSDKRESEKDSGVAE